MMSEKMVERKKYPIKAEDYELYEEVGHGVSAAVHRALCITLQEVVAIKVLDFERDNSDLNNIMREAQTMTLIDHPNVVKAHCSFVHGQTLWVVMPYMGGGSCLHIMKSAFPEGLDEAVIATILKETLKGLEYIHQHGHIHRDVKAGNILVDSVRGIKLGDFGVSACLFDGGDRQRQRNTFVGTPCWMAPEVLEQMKGYDFKADIWSFGITALELAHGHAPFSKYPPMKVLLMTLQNPPPGLDSEKDRSRFSRSFKHMIGQCLVKDPRKRPTAKKLLKHPFFKQARSQDYINKKMLDGLPMLGDQYKALKEKEEALLAQKKMPDGQKEELSQNEYKRGISSWNFDLDDLKAQAALIPDVDENGMSSKESELSLFEIDSVNDKSSESGSSGSCSAAAPQKLETESVNGDIQHEPEEKPKTTNTKQKGRFKVTTSLENVDIDKCNINLQKSFSMQAVSRVPPFSPSTSSHLLTGPMHHQSLSIHAQLHAMLHTNLLQRDHILSMMKQVTIGSFSPASVASSSQSSELPSPPSPRTHTIVSEKSLLESAFETEKELLSQIADLQWRLLREKEEKEKLKRIVS
ncbi:Protein kinase superfamily protein [Rhynchospora pubera]|uniref:Protein kinase superfamily protein n=1 Tax=Rhynchospora pubera TaxID=906938 RepID=A0AAV8FLW0_9POAL|nr:Protein kinase superfamily protein [Rhynchospora pubera]